MMDDNEDVDRHPTNEQVIPDGTQFVIVDLDYDNERVQVEFSLNGRVMRAWLPASQLQKMTLN